MTFANERAVKAVRKSALCDACGQRIQVGEPAVRWAGMGDGMFMTAAYHPECREAEVALNELHGTYYDDWMGLADIEYDDHRWLLAEHPVVAERKGITLASIEEDEREREACRIAWAEIERKRREQKAPRP